MEDYVIYISFLFGIIVSVYLKKTDLPSFLLVGSKTLCMTITIIKITKYIGRKFDPTYLAGLAAAIQLAMFI